MVFKNIGLIDENFDYRKDCTVITDAGRISYIGEGLPAGYDVNPGEEIYDGTGKVMIPGLVNAHTHTAMTALRGYGGNLNLHDWLNKKVFPFEAHYKPDTEGIYCGNLLGIAEMLRFGTVASTDMYFNAEGVFRAVKESGFRMDFGLTITSFDDTPIRQDPIVLERMDFLKRHQGEACLGELFNFDLSLHAEYTSSERAVRELVELCREFSDPRMQVHISETKFEHEGCKERHGGKTPVRYLYDLGLLDFPTTAGHCVWIEGEDFDLLADKHVTVACNPISNMKLASGFADIKTMMEKGINIALGTDGVSSNNNLNLFEELKLYAILYKGSSGDPTLVSAKDALYAATRAGALSQGRPDGGLIKEGYVADIAILDLNHKPYAYPVHDMLENIVFAAQGSDVCLTMVNGQILYRDGEYPTIDLERAMHGLNESIDRVLKKL